ncbi:MAG: N-acetylmuramoyl-L-alanine amidase [bacterium]|nr:N-acetylmuramoyl-L-alanine amidase [bacterium]
MLRKTFYILGLISLILSNSLSFIGEGLAATAPKKKKPVPTRAPVVKPMIEEIRYWPGPEDTNITLDFKGTVVYRTRDISGKMGLVLQTENAPYKEGKKNIYVADGLIDSINVVPEGNGCVVTILFTVPTEYEMKKTGKYQNKPELLIINVVRPESLRVKKIDVTELQNWEKTTNGKLVIIDPGHGGFDYGAIGYNGLKEKDVNLDLAFRLKKKIDAMPNMRAVLTRDGDYYVSLSKRQQITAELVNELNSKRTDKKVDIIFISIHQNAPAYSWNRDARGTEIYFLNFGGATDEAAELVAKYENEADLGLASESRVEDPLLNGVLAEMVMRGLVNESSILAGMVLKNIKQMPMLVSRGVKSARFAVLKVPTPSVLFEVAFITNPYEASLLQDDGFKETITDKLADAIYTYFYFRPENEPIITSSS